MMRQLMRIRAIFLVAVKRLIAQRLLTFATIIGLIIAVALILTIPVYSESVAFRVLTERLTADEDTSNRPPFSYLIGYIGSWNEPVNLEATDEVDRFLRTDGGQSLGLNITRIVRHLETMNFRLYPASESDYTNENVMLDFVTFGTTEAIEDNIELIEGRAPVAGEATPESTIEVMIHEEFASEFGIQVGNDFVGYDWRLEAGDPLQIMPIRVVGIWRPINENSPYWFYRTSAFEDILLVNSETFVSRISPYTEQEVNLAVWYVVTDGSGVNTSRVNELIQRNNDTEATIDDLLPGTYFQSAPVDELEPYKRITDVLTLTLTVFSIPVVALLIVFLMMIIGLVVDGQRNETAVLRSRGTSPLQIIGLAMVEGLIMGVVALAVGLLLAGIFTQLLGTTRSFMDFNYSSEFIVSYPTTILTTALLALIFTIVIRILPTISASRHTIISYKADRSRLIRRPLWQRLGLDLMLMVVLGYFYYQIVQQGGLIDVEGIGSIEEAYDQPFVFLLPPLTILALTLFLLRFLPLFLRFLAWFIQLTNSVGLLIVTRQLERNPRAYYLPLILLISTISLGIYTASFARTIDRYLYEQQFYRVPADISVRVFSQEVSSGLSGSADGAPPAYMHISEFSGMDNVQDATRFGEYRATARLTSGSIDGKFIGVDRADIGKVIFWRPDFASVRLGYLLNALGNQPDSVLVSRDFMTDRNLTVGDFIQVEVAGSGASFTADFQVVGALDYFPRWYPEDDGPLFVGNLDFVFERAQNELSHRILARVESDFNERDFVRAVIARGAAGVLIDEPYERIEREQTRPERQGLFGLLSIGFVTSSLATMIGFLLYTIFSYQQRYVELGILRAIGLSQSAMIVSVAWELGLLILTGLIFGLGIGLAVSFLYIPYMQFVSNLAGITPPYLVMIAWTEIIQIMGLFVLTFVVIMLILLMTLRRMRIFQAVKLGETL